MNKHQCQLIGGVALMAFIAVLAAFFLRSVLIHNDDDINRDGDGLTSQAERIRCKNSPAPDNSMVLVPVITGEEPFLLSYSVPVHTDLSTNRCVLELIDNGIPVNHEFIRQTNGTYLVFWNTIFASYGSHILQVCLEKPTNRSKVYGPKRTEIVTNLIRFDPAATSFGSRACIDGTLHVPSADYRIDIYDTTNNFLRTIAGHTDEGIIHEIWNLTTTNGQVRNDQEFMAKVYIRPSVASNSNLVGSNAASFSVPYPLSLFREGRAETGIRL